MPSLPIAIGSVTSDKCYIFSGTMNNLLPAESPAEVVLRDAASVIDYEIGEINTNGSFEFSFTPAPGVSYNEITIGGYGAADFYITGIALKVDPQCIDSACSECLELVDSLDCDSSHVVVQYYNDNNAFGLNYTNFNFQPVIIIKGGVQNAEFNNNDESLFNSSDGNKFLHYVNQREQQELIIEAAPPYLHKALARALEHHHVFLNGVEYVKTESGYTPDYDRRSLLAPCIVNVEEKLQNGFNRRC